MKNSIKIVSLCFAVIAFSNVSFAGNPEKIPQKELSSVNSFDKHCFIDELNVELFFLKFDQQISSCEIQNVSHELYNDTKSKNYTAGNIEKIKPQKIDLTWIWKYQHYFRC